MALTYRTIWQDDPEGLHERALASFAWWVSKRSSVSRTFEPGRTETDGVVSTLVQAGSGHNGSIQRCALHLDDGTDRRTTTLITTSSATQSSVWVDLERVSHRAFSTYHEQGSPLTTHLITHGIRPRRGPLALGVQPLPLPAPEIPRFISLLADHARDLPILVLASSPGFSAADWHEPASHIAHVLAGNALTYVVGPVGCVNLTEILGDELGVEPGGARLFLPRVSPDEPNPARHRLLTADQVARDRNGVADLILQFLGPATAARRAPAEYAELRALLQVDTEAIVAENLALEERITNLESQLASTEDQVIELLADLEGSEQRVNLLQAALATVGDRTTPDRPTSDGAPVDVTGLVDAARAAQRHLTGIVLPDAACQDLEVLDRRIESGAWGRTAWRGLLALHAFALDRDYQPGFWLWCKANRSPFSWPATGKKLAMRESETVMANEVLAAKRRFPIDPAVSAGGLIEMQAHLKIAEGGNHQIPRIYFYDDRHGATGKVHIGFFGPHGYVPNTLS